MHTNNNVNHKNICSWEGISYNIKCFISNTNVNFVLTISYESPYCLQLVGMGFAPIPLLLTPGHQKPLTALYIPLNLKTQIQLDLLHTLTYT
jgi:hypothetical protein